MSCVAWLKADIVVRSFDTWLTSCEVSGLFQRYTQEDGDPFKNTYEESTRYKFQLNIKKLVFTMPPVHNKYVQVTILSIKKDVPLLFHVKIWFCHWYALC